MRFCVDLILENPYLPKEKNKLIMHILKLLFENTDPKHYKDLYERENNKEKNFTFSTYLGKGAKFNKENIFIPEQRILLNFSSYSISEGILFYNSFVKNIGLEIPIKNNKIIIEGIREGKRGLIKEETKFSTASPIIVREHKGDNKQTWYHDISDNTGWEVFKNNLKYQLKSNLENLDEKDLDEIKINVEENKIVKIKHYGIVIPANLTKFNISAKAYIIDYIYKAGIGGRRSQGFGYLNIE